MCTTLVNNPLWLTLKRIQLLTYSMCNCIPRMLTNPQRPRMISTGDPMSGSRRMSVVAFCSIFHGTLLMTMNSLVTTHKSQHNRTETASENWKVKQTLNFSFFVVVENKYSVWSFKINDYLRSNSSSGFWGFTSLMSKVGSKLFCKINQFLLFRQNIDQSRVTIVAEINV